MLKTRGGPRGVVEWVLIAVALVNVALDEWAAGAFLVAWVAMMVAFDIRDRL